MSGEPHNPVEMLQAMINAPPDPAMAPPYVRGIGLVDGVKFESVASGVFDLEWTIEAHLTHVDGFVQGGVVNVVADTGQSFAFMTTSIKPETFSTAEFTTRFFRPMKTGEVINVNSKVINRSRRIGVVETNFVNQETGKLCAIVTGAWMVVNRDFGPPA